MSTNITVTTTDGVEHTFVDGDHYGRDDHGNIYIYDEDDNTIAEFSRDHFKHIQGDLE